MKHHRDLTDAEFESRFDKLTLDPSLFSHEAHLRLGWIHIRKYGKELAIKNICDQIKAFDQKHGDGTKFNRDLTISSIEVLASFMKDSEANNFQQFINDNPVLRTDFMKLVAQHR